MINLELSNIQTLVLYNILERIGGHPERSYRGEADKIQTKLLYALVNNEHEGLPKLTSIVGSIRFEDFNQ